MSERGGKGRSRGIAVVGIACRYADARSPAELWETALAGRRGFRRIPPERLRLEDYARPGDPDGLYATEAAVLEGWEFDRLRFRVAGPTFRAADLAHWLALEVAADALADAGHAEAAGLPRETAGVVVGNTLTGEFSRAGLLRLRWPYVRRTLAAALGEEGWKEEPIETFLARLEAAYKAPFPETSEESLAGGLSNTIAGRISNHFDLHGGGYTVDGACASSLLAVANACSALAAGDLDFALAGGVDLSLDPFELAGFARNGALARGEMRVYDRRADGFIPGEGCGFVALVREEEARAAGRRVHAVIRGWGISSDGHGGISRPEEEGQLLALARAYRRAGFGIETVGYFEGHGTGTAVGDATELAALARARRAAGAARPAPVGSIKANFGHTKAAAGVAGLMKATLALAAQVVPPMPAAAGGDEPAGEVAVGGALYVPREAAAWPADRPLRAGVSAMGFGGINVHLAVEGAAGARRRGMTARERRLARSPQDCELLAFAAADAAGLAREVARAAELAVKLSRAELGDLAAALARDLGKVSGPARAAVVAATPREAGERLAALAGWLRREEREEEKEKALDKEKPELPRGVFAGWGTAIPPRVGLLFPGQGSPIYPGGGAWRRRFEWLEDLWAAGGADAPETGSEVDTAAAQPAIVAAALAGLRALGRLGIGGEVAVGHSLGEIAALAWAGALGEKEAVELAAARGRAMAEAAVEAGAMASLGAEPAAVAALLSETAGGAVIAACNGSRRTVVSGPAAAVEAAAERAATRGWAVHRLRVSHAFHSPLMAGAAPRLDAALGAVGWAPAVRRVASTVSGEILPAGADLAALLRAQLTSPVRFDAALAAARPHADLWLEVGPGRALAELAGELLGAPVLALDAGGPSLAGLLAAAAACFAAGAPVELATLFEDRFTRPFDPARPLRFLASPCESAPLAPPPAEVAPETATADRMEHPASGASEGPAPEAPLALVRRLVAERAELPPAAVAGESRLLADLHLNSIAVGQLVVEASRRLGLPSPAAPTDYAQATVAEVAAALAARAATGERSGEEDGRPPAGVAPWLRSFAVEHRPRPLARRRSSGRAPERTGAWPVIAPPGHPVAAALPAALAAVPGGGVALCLPAAPEDEPTAAVDLFLAAARAVLAAPRPGRFLLVQHGERGGGAFARTLHLELPAVATAVVDLPSDMDPREAAGLAAAEAAAVRGYAEARYSGGGRRSVPVLVPLPLPPGAPATVPLGPADVLLVSGGGKGIGAECALALARASGARLAILGRADPAADGELAANLARMAAAGAPALYARVDVAEAAQVAAAVARVTAALGPVTALLHAAGANRPRPLSELDRAGFLATLAPKVSGARNLLAALDPAPLRLAVGFGSIIARAGLPGEADYAVGNDWLGALFARHGAAHPACRCLVVEWSVWAGAGMGERLGTLAALERAGIAAIPLDDGVRALAALLARPPAVPAVVVSGRFGAPPTLALAPASGTPAELPLRRFLERPRVHYPGVELVADSLLSADTDPYLKDHVFRGEPLFPAVLGLEAMAQAAMALAGAASPPVFEAVELRRPIAISPGAATTLRVAALAREDGAVEVALRDAATGFAADCFRAVCRFDLPPPETGLDAGAAAEDALAIDPAADGSLGIDPRVDLYGGILFQGGRFRRLQEYRSLSATACRAEISADGATAWFGAYLPGELVLGDPGARDAAIHGIQACIPHAHLLPVGAERIVAGRLPARGSLALAARERRRDGQEFVYDLTIRDASGHLVERWEGLRLRAIDRTPAPGAWPAPLLAPYLERRLEELLPGAGLRVVLAAGGAATATGRPDSGPAVARLLAGTRPAAPLRHRPDGRPEVAGGPRLSIAHAGGLVLAVAGLDAAAAVGCDLEPVAARPAEDWRGLLGDERWALARLLTREGGEAEDAAATRVWAAAEALVKAGAARGASLTFDAAADGGWLLLRAGRFRAATLALAVRELGRAALAVAVEASEERRPAARAPRDLGRELPAIAGGGDA
jgi:enediyne polyketide synthase